MPASTRSKTKQARIDEPSEIKAPVQTSKRKAKDAKAPSKKQKTASSKEPAQNSTSPDKRPRAKKADPKTDDNENKETDSTTDKRERDEDIIMINRAPVLLVWAATVTAFLYPKLSWESCLSAGSAISTLCAISKGRSVGKIDPPDPEKAERNQRDRRAQAEKDKDQDLEVMHFNLKLKNSLVLVSGKPEKASEGVLKKLFRDKQYRHVKAVFEEALSSWRGKEEELNAQAFHFYEAFRPNVPAGQKGWGQKGQLNLKTVKSVINQG